MRNPAIVLYLAMLGLLAGCATPKLQGSVTKFHQLSATPRTFVIVPDQSQADSLEFRSYAKLVRAALQSHSWTEQDFATADVAVFFQYQISQGRRVEFSYPIFGQVPTGRSSTVGNISTYGNRATVNAVTTNQTTTAIVGTGVAHRTEYDRALRVLMFSLPAYRTSQKMERIFEGEIRSTGSTSDLPTVMPQLVQGFFTTFPGSSGVTEQITLPIK